MVPFWVPSIWIAAGFLLCHQHPFLILLGYHGLLAFSCLRARSWRWGRLDHIAWAWLAAGIALLVLPFLLPPFSFFPAAATRALLARWPGGLWGHLPYALLVNAPLEEGYWRGALEACKPQWSSWQMGVAFGLHHGVAAALTLPWPWVLPAFLVPATVGAFWSSSARRTGGLRFSLLSHALADLLLICFVARQLG
jgi:hypothetical protein